MKTIVAASLMLSVLTVQTANAHDVTDDNTITDLQDQGQPVVEAEQPVVVRARVRLTYYVEAGRTYSGQQTYAGSTACSWNWPIGTRFVFRDGETVVCNDRGMLGSGNPIGWLDLWRRPDLVRKYGDYATVEVLP